ncbi:unnamed protein product [Didymodactylos carnosus]|uniref:Uncharacterized protein n=1 Tax=Didymodactylos carnosus TaxID=1234261 RepID=A0A8S2JEU2_9BILA|nr:unnamed protein product [Didymodactylos carnosus]CAF3796386.1 unnamed protein product [Didymodactylos carnosus]
MPPLLLLTQLQSLTTLTLIELHAKDMIPLLKQLPHLSYLNIHNHCKHSKALITTVLKKKTLKTFIFKSLTAGLELPLTTQNTSNIEHLSIQMGSDSLGVLLCHLPKLRYLNIDLSNPCSFKNAMSDIPIMSCITKLKLEIHHFPISFVNQLFKSVPNLQYLHFIGMTSDKKCIDPFQWANLLSSMIGHLNRIKLNLHCWYLIREIPDCTEVIQKFRKNKFIQQLDIQIYHPLLFGESVSLRIMANHKYPI